jgi:hypothetical protein
MRLVMLILQNRENFRVTRSKPPPPTEDVGLPLAVSSRQEGVEKIASELDCQSGRLQLWRRSVGLIERLRQVMAAGQRPRLPGRENPGCGRGPQMGPRVGTQSRRAQRDKRKSSLLLQDATGRCVDLVLSLRASSWMAGFSKFLQRLFNYPKRAAAELPIGPDFSRFAGKLSSPNLSSVALSQVSRRRQGPR